MASRQFEAEAVPLPSGGCFCWLHDVTAAAARGPARRDVVANISHELRTPLASIKLLAETLADGAVADEETGRDFADQIQREVDHLAQLVDELLDLSMIESGEIGLAIEPVDTAPGAGKRSPSESVRSPRAVGHGRVMSRGPRRRPTRVRAAADAARLARPCSTSRTTR